ncbi:MAG TPA: protein-L-isoaspartate(D-aspartate) O-methyltransferase [Bacteroidia bacterium]|jgi:protein-L-isoaspartate(D-aspartate) O-methyltransferase|nr:protein-L-isoaspartate(D-aspartate) O-methyltransferase [Bacteroidia bacterium]
MEDLPKHKGLRKKLIDRLKEKGISDEKVLAAIGKVPRHLFYFDSTFADKAYDDIAFQIGDGQTISHPYTVALQTQLLDVKRGEKILEIGTGSGYQTAVLLELGAKVFSVERQKNLYDKTRSLLPGMKYEAKLFYGDGYKGLPQYGPFDKIIVTCGAPETPPLLLEQLKLSGILVIPLGAREQVMTTYVKTSENQYHKEEFGEFRFVPMLQDKARGL